MKDVLAATDAFTPFIETGLPHNALLMFCLVFSETGGINRPVSLSE